MEFLNHFRAFAYFLCGGLFFYCSSCRNINESGNQYKITTDSTYINACIQDMYDYSRIVEGVWFIRIKDSMYACGLKDYHTVVLRNLDKDSNIVDFILRDSIHSFVVKEGKVYCVSDNKHKITVLDFAEADIHHPDIDSIIFPPTFNDTVFNASNLHGPMLAGVKDDLLIRYRIDYSDNVNMLDRFVYKYIQGKPAKVESIIRQPAELMYHYQFMHQAIGTFNAGGDKLFYVFESIPKLYRYDMISSQVDSVTIPDFDIRKYDAGKRGDFTYLRNYLAGNDANRRLLYDANLLYLVKRNAENKSSKYTVFCFDTSLRPLARVDVPYKLNTEIVFMKDQKLYVYESQSNSKFYVFALGVKL